MASVNKVIVVGHLGRDPEVRYLPDGTAIANISLATSVQWTDKQSGERKEETEWHRVVFRARLAEVAGEYLHKGSHVYVEGRLRTRKWQDKEGIERYTTEVVASRLQMLGARPGGAEARAEPASGQQARTAQTPAATARAATGARFEDDRGDVPF